MFTWPWAPLWAALCVVPVVVAAWLVLAKPFRSPAGDVRGIAFGLWVLVAATLVSAWTSPFRAAALARVWPTLGGVALFFLLHHWLTAREPAGEMRAKVLGRIVAWVGATVVLVSLAAWLAAAPTAPWSNRNAWPFGHSNYTGGFAVLVLPWLAAQTWSSRSRARLAWALLAAAAAMALMATSSRGAVAALCLVGGLVAVAALVYAPWSRRCKLGLALGLVAAGALVIFSNQRMRDLVLRRHWSDAAIESNRQRSAMLMAGWRLGLERPLFGWGPGTVPLAYPRVRATLDGGVDNVLQLHNTPVQVWATLGGVGVLAAVILLGGTGLAAARALGGNRRSPETVTAAVSLFGYGVFTLTDHQLDVPVFAAICATNLAVLTSAATPVAATHALSSRARLVLGAIFGLLCVGPAIALGRDICARQAYEEALVAAEAGHSEDAILHFDRATEFTPNDAYFQHHAAAALLRLSEVAPDPARRAELRRAARARLEKSLATGAHTEYAHFNLGWLALETGQPADAATHFRHAAALVPDKGGVYFGLGLALQQAGQPEAAVRAFALEWLSDPRSALSPAWEVPALAALRPAVHAETLRLFAELRPLFPPATMAEQWVRWWWGEPVPPTSLRPGFSEASGAFAAALPAIATHAPVTSTAAWAQLYAAWRGGGDAAAFLPVTGNDRAFALALARRTQRHRSDFHSFLAAGTEDDAALLRTVRRLRTGYGVLALHPDGAPLSDLYVVQENRVTADFAAALFPAKGWLPGRLLLALLPAEPR